VPLREYGSQPRREAAASVEITEERSLEQLAIDAVGEFASTASGIERIGCTVERRPMLPNKKIPGPFVPRRAGARERKIFEMERVRVRAAFGASLECFNKPFERHPPSLRACPAIEALGERDVNRQWFTVDQISGVRYQVSGIRFQGWSRYQALTWTTPKT
jgi:hypothetical protein